MVYSFHRVAFWFTEFGIKVTKLKEYHASVNEEHTVFTVTLHIKAY